MLIMSYYVSSFMVAENFKTVIDEIKNDIEQRPQWEQEYLKKTTC